MICEVVQVMVSIVFALAEACSRRSVPKARPLPSVTPDTNQSAVAAASQSDCPEPYNTEFCLHQGSCFAIKIGDSPPSINCLCTPGWTGRRCELKDLPEEWFSTKEREDLREAALSGGVAVTILIVSILVVLIIVFVKRWQKQSRDARLMSDDGERSRGKSNETFSNEKRSSEKWSHHSHQHSAGSAAGSERT